MIIFNHQVFPRHFAAFRAPGGALEASGAAPVRARLDRQNSRSAQKTHEIKPNKAEPKNRRNNACRHREGSASTVRLVDFHKAEELPHGNAKNDHQSNAVSRAHTTGKA